ncbi:MAG TPA: hypothetical protein VFB62_12690 [Polyangiaceae bacterium]|nr:hypothetical protein [Polyangiaceae bacterium]
MSSISQREAQRLRKRVEELEDHLAIQRREWASSFPGGTHIGNITPTCTDPKIQIATARRLGHAVVVVNDSQGALMLYALPLPKAHP